MAKEQYHHSDLKGDLLKQGLKILVEGGYDNFSLRKVARACGVSQTAPYRHFKNKDELILTIAIEAVEKFNDSLQSAVDKYPDDPKSQIKEMGCAYIEFFVKNPEYLRLIFLSDVTKRLSDKENFQPEKPDCLTNFKKTGDPFETFFKTVERYKREGEGITTSAMSLEELLLYCWGLVHGIAILISRNEFPHEGDSLTLARNLLWNSACLN